MGRETQHLEFVHVSNTRLYLEYGIANDAQVVARLKVSVTSSTPNTAGSSSACPFFKGLNQQPIIKLNHGERCIEEQLAWIMAFYASSGHYLAENVDFTRAMAPCWAELTGNPVLRV